MRSGDPYGKYIGVLKKNNNKKVMCEAWDGKSWTCFRDRNIYDHLEYSEHINRGAEKWIML